MDLVEYIVVDGVARITLNRPPVNALNAELIDDIGAAISRAESPDVRAVVITGTPHFAAGADIAGFQAGFDGEGEDELAGDLSGVVTRLEVLEKPTIAAINGFALGGGLELAMGADFRYLAEDATVGQPEIKLGIMPGAGGTQRLPRLVGYQRALEMCLSGRSVDAAGAQTLGIADEVIATGDVVDAAMAAAVRFAAGPTAAYAAMKRTFRKSYGAPIDEGLAIEAAEFARALNTDDARIGIAAFLAKQRPSFTGR